MNEIKLSPDLEKAILGAAYYEDRDEHLTTEQRQCIVDMFKRENPSVELPANLDDAFVTVIYDF
jgi:hypothetical protein